MALNDIYRVRIHQRMHGQEVLNVWHFVDDAGAAGDQGTALCQDIITNMATTMRARACSDMVFEFVEAVKLVPYGEGPVTVSYPANTVGTATGSAGTGTLAEVVTVYTSLIGRRHRGRMYLAGGPSTTISGGSWPAAQTTRTQAFCTAFAARYMATPGGFTFKFGVWSKAIAGPDPPWPSDSFTRATSLTVRTLVRNQRRRQIGVGR